jgi:DNA-binding beta-propeller fold protein YncE
MQFANIYRYNIKEETMSDSLKRLACLLVLALLTGCAAKTTRPDYSEYVWPPPPNQPRIQLVDILYGRADVEADSSFQRALLGATPDPYYQMRKPFAAAYDVQGRLLVTDPGLAALLRFDRERKVMEVLGTKGPVTLKVPLGLATLPDGSVLVADVGLRMVVAMDPEGKIRAVYGSNGELTNPTDAIASPDGTKLYVADSKEHKIHVFDRETAELLFSFGGRGEGEGEFQFPTSLAFDAEGNLLVVDQLNSRMQTFTEEGAFLDQFGQLGVGFGDFVRPKDVAVDELGLIYVSDAAFNNLQLFDTDFALLTYVGGGGKEPGEFQVASGVAVRGGEFAVVDQLNQRVQLFRFLAQKARD